MKNHWAETILWFIAGLTNQFGNWSIETSYNDPKHSSQFKLVSVKIFHRDQWVSLLHRFCNFLILLQTLFRAK